MGKKDLKTEDKSKACVVIPYVKGLSESLARVVKKWHIRIYSTTIHAEDCLGLSQRQSGMGKHLWYRELKYIGETGRKFNM